MGPETSSGRRLWIVANFSSRCLIAVGAPAAHLDHGALGRESRRLGGMAHAGGHRIVVEMHRLPAHVADEEDAIVQAPRMRVGDIGVGAFHSSERSRGGKEWVSTGQCRWSPYH